MILTDAEIESTPLLDENVCNGCKSCADNCLLGVSSKDVYDEVEICGKKFNFGRIDYSKCIKCENGAVVNGFSTNSKPDRIAALCNRSCLCGIEERKTLTNVF